MPLKRFLLLGPSEDPSMTEIRVERKGMPVWAILIGLVVLAVILWAVVAMRNRGRQQDVDHTALMAPTHVLVLETHRAGPPLRFAPQGPFGSITSSWSAVSSNC
jgi:hypothetical protein